MGSPPTMAEEEEEEERTGAMSTPTLLPLLPPPPPWPAPPTLERVLVDWPAGLPEDYGFSASPFYGRLRIVRHSLLDAVAAIRKVWS